MMASSCMNAGGCLDVVDSVHVSTLKLQRWAQQDKQFLERLSMKPQEIRETYLAPPSPYRCPVEDEEEVATNLHDLNYVRRQKYLQSYTFTRKDDVRTTDKYLVKSKSSKQGRGRVYGHDGRPCSVTWGSIFAMLFVCVARGSAKVNVRD